MPLQGDVYVVENNPSTYIICLERCEGSNDHPGVGFRETELESLIARMESEAGHRDALQGTVMDMVIFRTIFFELLVFFTFTLLTLHSIC